MPYEIRGKCVHKKGEDKPLKCHDSIKKAKKHLTALNLNVKNENFVIELKDYFSSRSDEDYLRFDGHPLSDLKSLMDDESPAPWDHLTNTADDGDVDVDVQEDLEDG